MSSSATISAACSKWLGSGNSWLSVPRKPAFGHHCNAVARAAASDSAQQTVTCAYRGPLPPAASKAASKSGFGLSRDDPVANLCC